MIQIHITAQNSEELRTTLEGLLGQQKIDLLKAESRVPEAETVLLKEEPRRPWKDGEDCPVPGMDRPSPEEDVPEVHKVPDVMEVKQPTMAEARAALNELRAAKGPKAVKAILEKFGVKSFVDLAPEQYADVMKEAEDAAE